MGAGSTINSASLLRFIRQGKSFSGHERHCCFLNTGKTQFANISSVAGLDFEDDGRAVGVVDWDFDGDLDFWVTNRNAPQLRFLRNDLAADSHSIAIRLRGTECNRDGIGARVELSVAGDQEKRIRTLRAGDGFLSQSSKWLHFGLGNRRVSSVVVRWPNGKPETFHGLAAGRRYILEQGSSHAASWEATTGPVLGAAANAPLSDQDDAIRAFCVSRIPVPRLPYKTLQDEDAEVFRPRSGEPVLLNFWASWCTPCQKELKALAEAKAAVEAAGLTVVALSVDGLDGGETGAANEVNSLLDRLDFPFRTGRADAKLVEKIQILNDFSFDLHLPLPVPTSVLIDGKGQLAALYKGPVPVAQVLADVAVLGQDASESRDRTTGFSGRWQEPLNTVSFVPVLDALTARGFLEAANEYVTRIGTASKAELLPAIARLGIACYKRGMHDKAQKHFGVIAKIDPQYVGVQTQLGKLYEDQGRFQTAIKLYGEAISRNPKSLRGLNNLAWLLATCSDKSLRNGDEAVKQAILANDLSGGDDPNVLDTLAAAYAQAGDFGNARVTAKKALRLAQSRGRLLLADQIKRRLENYNQDLPVEKN